MTKMSATILVVEDDPTNRRLVLAILTLSGHEVLEADAAGPAIELAKSASPDVILMDVGLPDMDGLDASRILKEDPATRHIPIIAVTGRAMPADEEQVRAAGCDAYVAKPYDIDTLTETLALFIESHEA